MVHPDDVVFLNQLLAFDKERIVNAASTNEELRRDLVRWASELSSAAALLVVEGTRPDNPHHHCQQAGRCIARGSGRCRAGREDRPTALSNNPTAPLIDTTATAAALTEAAGVAAEEIADEPKQKRRKLSTAEPWTTQEEISLLELVSKMPRNPKFKEEYEALANGLGTGRSGPAVKQHFFRFEAMARSVVKKLPESHASRHESHALPFKLPAWFELGARPDRLMDRFPGVPIWDKAERRVYDRLHAAMTGAQPHQLEFGLI
jgi:hypothetical protein